jgi:hypothetical protein
VPVSDASARCAAAWLEAWARAGLLGSDPEVVGFVADLIRFVGERTMDGKLTDTRDWAVAAVRCMWGMWADHRCVGDAENDANDAECEAVVRVIESQDARVRELEAENARLREGLKPFAEWSKGWHANWPDHLPVNETKTDDSPTLGDCRLAAELLGGTQ